MMKTVVVTVCSIMIAGTFKLSVCILIPAPIVGPVDVLEVGVREASGPIEDGFIMVDAKVMDCEPLEMPLDGCSVGLTLRKVADVVTPPCWLSESEFPAGVFAVPVDGLVCEVVRVTGVTICARSTLDVDIDVVSRG